MLLKTLAVSIFILIFSAYTMKGQDEIVNKIKLLKDSSLTEIENEDFHSALKKINEALRLSNQISNNELKANCLFISGNIYLQLKQNHFALGYYLRSANLYERIGDNIMLSVTYYRIALIKFNDQSYQRSIDYFHLSERVYSAAYKSYSENYKLKEYLGDAFYRLDLNDSAQYYYNALYQISNNANDTSGIITSINKLIQIFKREKQFNKAIQKNEELYNIYKIRDDYKGMAVTKNNIAYLYVISGDNEKALNAFREAEQKSRKSTLGDKFYVTTLTNVGICLQNMGDTDISVKTLLKAKGITDEDKDNKERAVINNILAIVYFQKDDLYNAAEYSLESIADAKKSNDPVVLKNCYKTYSTILQALDDYQEAMDFFKKHLEIRDSLLVEKRVSEQIINQHINESERLEKNIQVKMADEEVKDMLLKQFKLEAEKREQELELLNKEKELDRSEKEVIMKNLSLERQKRDALIKEQHIKTLEYDKEMQNLILKQKEIEDKEKQKAIMLLEVQNEKKELTIEKQEEQKKRFTWTFGFVMIILALIIYSLISARKKNSKLKVQKKQIEQSNDELNQQNEEISAQKEYLEKANKQISEQNTEIESKNIEITDSIRYAERIQKAVLPPIDLKSVGLKDYFIFYKPKDIVSGDFYWMKQIGENVIIAIADCTGHGVPGAFMSMLGISYLNEIVTKTRFDNAGIILDRLRRKVKKSLGQTGKEFEQKDGMDMVMIIIDTENMTLQYAGANNPLLIISKGQENLIKADRMPIGIHHNEINFTNHLIKLNNGDIIYAFSDGFQDQFGGIKGKKYLSRRFRDLLFEIHTMKMNKQAEILEKSLVEWQSYTDETGNSYDQVDDILVIGIEV